MSDKLRMQATDKVEVKAAIKVLVKTKLERVSVASGLKIGTYLAAIIEEHASHIETTKEDLDRATELVAENIRKRAEKKARKGIA